VDDFNQMRAPTHPAPDMPRLLELGDALVEEAEMTMSGELTAGDLEAFADNENHRLLDVWIAAGLHPEVEVARSHDIAFGVCVGRCQLWGAAPVLQALLALSEARSAAGQPSFDVVARGCLNRCEDAPFVAVSTPDGVFGVGHASAESVVVAVAQVMGDEDS
jgi:(2Fe-2S) ferredoxin